MLALYSPDARMFDPLHEKSPASNEGKMGWGTPFRPRGQGLQAAAGLGEVNPIAWGPDVRMSRYAVIFLGACQQMSAIGRKNSRIRAPAKARSRAPVRHAMPLTAPPVVNQKAVPWPHSPGMAPADGAGIFRQVQSIAGHDVQAIAPLELPPPWGDWIGQHHRP
jgi:hypothetical protein